MHSNFFINSHAKGVSFSAALAALLAACVGSAPVPGSSAPAVTPAVGASGAGGSTDVESVKSLTVYIVRPADDAGALFAGAMAVPSAASCAAVPSRFVLKGADVELTQTAEYRFSRKGSTTVYRGADFTVEAVDVAVRASRAPRSTGMVSVHFSVGELRSERPGYRDDPYRLAVLRAVTSIRRASGLVWISAATFDPEGGFSFTVAFGD